MAFIHGEVLAGADDPEARRQRVADMATALPALDRPVDVVVLRGPSATCVLALTADEAPAGRRPLRVETRLGANLSIAADVQLHDRMHLADALGVPRARAGALGDGELIMIAYERWGTSCFKRLLGDGAAAIWDGSDQTLICWRDVVGVRPLYYHRTSSGGLVFSSDLRSLHAHPSVPGVLDLAYTRALLEIDEEYYHPTRTLSDGVRKLEPGHTLTSNDAQVTLRRYWDPSQIEPRKYPDPRDYVEELRALVVAAVTCRLPSGPDPVGAHLSGGLDSSSIAVTARREHTDGDVLGFSWAPSWDVLDEVQDDERHLAEAAAGMGPMTLNFTTLDVRDYVDLTHRDLAVEPRTTLLCEHAASRSARELGVRTMLSGWGGDEFAVFNGRGYLADLARKGRWITLHRELSKRARVHESSVLRDLRSRVLVPLVPDPAWKRLRPPPPAMLPSELRPDVARLLASVEPLGRTDLRERPGVRRMQLALLDVGHLSYRAESWAAHGAGLGISYRFPLLDRRIVEFALSIPDFLYFHDGWKRWLYRTAMEGVLPDDVRWHPRKADNAMSRQIARVRAKALPAIRDSVRQRVDNPFVDPAVLLSNRDVADDGRPIGRAMWMAFTRLRPA